MKLYFITLSLLINTFLSIYSEYNIVKDKETIIPNITSNTMYYLITSSYYEKDLVMAHIKIPISNETADNPIQLYMSYIDPLFNQQHIYASYKYDNDFMTLSYSFFSNSKLRTYIGFISNRNIEYVKILYKGIDNNNDSKKSDSSLSTLDYLKIIAILFIVFDITCILIFIKYFRICHYCNQNRNQPLLPQNIQEQV